MSVAELFVILLVGFIVLGPKRLPVVARFIGHQVARLLHLSQSFKQEFEQYTYQETLQKNIKKAEEAERLTSSSNSGE